MRKSALLPFALLVLLAACEEKRPDWAKEGAAGAALPPQVCAQVKKALDEMRSRGADYSDKGEATIPVPAWDAIPPPQRDALASALAFQAACAARSQSDAQEVVIRGDDGSELLRRTLSTRVETSDILRGD